MKNITVRLALKEDIIEVKKLLETHHVKNLNEEERKDGFVTTDMTIQQLTSLQEKENGITIAIDNTNNKIVALLLGGSWDFLKVWPMFEYMTGILKDYKFENKALEVSSSYQYGPICIAKEYRGLKIGEALLKLQLETFSSRFPNVVTFVNVLNPRSYAFHIRNKFEDLGLFSFNNNKYHMMAIKTK